MVAKNNQIIELEDLSNEQVNEIEMSLPEENTIVFADGLREVSQLPIATVDETVDFSKVPVEKTELPKYKDASQFNCKYLNDFYVESYEKKFETTLFKGEHTWNEWQEFWKEFLSNEFVEEYDSDTYSLEVIKV